MAGLGETCTHVSAVLFAVNTFVRIEKAKTVTEEAAYWSIPGNVDKVRFSAIEDIDFTAPKTMKRNLDCLLSSTPKPQQKRLKPKVNEPSDDEMNILFNDLHKTRTRPGILSIVPGFSEEYVPQCSKQNNPWLASEIRKDKCCEMPREELREECVTLWDSDFFTVTTEQSEMIERQTKGQSCNRMWHRFRAGRITASNMKKACQTSSEKPAMSTLKTICYPSGKNLKTKATQWGCSHEKDAISRYTIIQKSKHERLRVDPSGFVICTEYSFLGATPDSMINCECCGKGTLEVKCPYCVRDAHIADALGKDSSLEQRDGTICLKRSHAHYYQCQAQMFVCDADYTDYVVWTNKDIHIERILPDFEFLKVIVKKSEDFFLNAILPELLGAYFSRPKPHGVHNEPITIPQVGAVVEIDENNNSPPPVQRDVKLYCVCRTPYDDSLVYIGCDNQNCVFKWFHLKCANVKRVPSGEWICPYSKAIMQQ